MLTEASVRGRTAPSGYNLFVQAYHGKTPMKGLSLTERTAKVSEAWAKADKAQWNEMAEQEKLRLQNARGDPA